MNRKTAFFILMAVWFLMIASYTAFKEYNLKTGKSVMLKVVPVDPRDLFRGDYVILDYEISSPHKGQRILGEYGNFMEDESVYHGEQVYVMLIKNGSHYKAGDIYKSRPKDGLFIKGMIKKDRRFFGMQSTKFRILYGIENYFVPEGKGLELEKEREKNNIAAEVKINAYGDATIKNLYINGKKADLKNNNEKNN